MGNLVLQDRPNDDICNADHAWAHGDGVYPGRHKVYPDEIAGGGQIVSSRIQLIDDWYDGTGGTWGVFDSDGLATNAPAITHPTSGARRGGSNATTQCAWNGTANGEYIVFTMPNNTIDWSDCNFLRWFQSTDTALAAGALTVGFYDGQGDIIGSAVSVGAQSATSTWQNIEIDIRSLRDRMAGRGVKTIRITNTASAAGQTVLFESLIGYELSNGKGPVMGQVVRLTADGAEARGTLQSLIVGRDDRQQTASSNDTLCLGPVIEGDNRDENAIFAVPAAAGDDMFVQWTGPLYLRSTGTTALGDPVSVVTSTTVDNENAAGQSFGKFEEIGAANQDTRVSLGAGNSYDYAYSDDIVANSITGGDTSLGITGQAAASATAAGGAIAVASAAGGATSGNGGAISFSTGSATTTGVGGALQFATGNGMAATNAGGALTLDSGKGGDATTTTGGVGGVARMTSGIGGSATTGTGGAGGAAGLVTGAGGATTGATGTGGAGGALSVTSGAGGACSDAAGGAEVGGQGGDIGVTGGAGGAINAASVGTGGAGADITYTAGAGGVADNASGTGGSGGSVVLNAAAGGASAAGTVGAPGRVRVGYGTFRQTVQTIDMGDAAVTLTLVPGTPTGTLLTGNILFVDANSGTTESLLLPPEGDCTGLVLTICNTGGEDIDLKNDAGGDPVNGAVPISTTECGFAACDGTSWYAGVIKLT